MARIPGQPNPSDGAPTDQPPTERELNSVGDVPLDEAVAIGRALVGEVANPIEAVTSGEVSPVERRWGDAIAAASLVSEARDTSHGTPVPRPRLAGGKGSKGKTTGQAASTEADADATMLDDEVRSLVAEYGGMNQGDGNSIGEANSDSLRGSPEVRSELRRSIDRVQNELTARATDQISDKTERRTELARIGQASRAIRDTIDAHSTPEELKALVQQQLRARMEGLLKGYHNLERRAERARIPAQGEISESTATVLERQRTFVAGIAEILTGLDEDDRVRLELTMQQLVRNISRAESGFARIAEDYDKMMKGLKLEVATLRALQCDPDFELRDRTGAIVRAGTGWRAVDTEPHVDVTEHIDLVTTIPSSALSIPLPSGVSGVEIGVDVKAAGSFRAGGFAELAVLGYPRGAFAVKTVSANGERRQVLVVNPEVLGGLAIVPAGGAATLESIDLANPAGFSRAFKEAAKVFVATHPQSVRRQLSS